MAIRASRTDGLAPRTAAVTMHETSFQDQVKLRIEATGAQFDVEANRLLSTLVRAANLLVADLDSEVWRPFGVSYAGFRVIFAVWVMGPLEPRAISQLASVSRATVSAVINTLERDGYVARTRESADRRLVTVRLTEKGLQLWRDSFEHHNARERRWAAALTPAECETMVTLLDKLIRKRCLLYTSDAADE